VTHPPAVMRIRAQAILSECIGAGKDVTHDALQGICREKFAKDTPYIEREEIITQAMELHVAQKRGEAPSDGTLTTAEVRMHARDFFRKDPKASSPEAWEYVKSIGTPSIRFTSFQSTVCVDVRKELGIKGPKGGGKRRRQRGTVGKASARVPEGLEPVVRREETTRAKQDPATDEFAISNGNGPGPLAWTPGPAGGSLTSPAVTLTEAEARASATEAARDDDRDQITLETPGGRLTARHEGADTWLVEFRGAVPAEVVHLLVADLVGPFTGRKEAVA